MGKTIEACTGHRVVEELESDDTDTQGVDLASTSGSRRFASDPLRFTGIDLGGGGRSRSSYAYHRSGHDDSTEDDSQATSDEDTQDEGQAAMEDALVQSALARIRKAQARGKQEVKLNKEELAALERRRRRLQAEADNERKRKKQKEQRYSVPLSHFEAPAPRRRRGPSKSDDALPQHPSPSNLAQSQERLAPPMGRFPPPNAARTRPRSATSASQRPQSEQRGSSPFDYQYVSSPSNQRHVSDTAARASSSQLPYPPDENWRPTSSQSYRSFPDPFQFQTAGPRAPPLTRGAAAARRNVSNPSDVSHGTVPRRGAPAAARSAPSHESSEETSEEDDEDEDEDEEATSDEHGNGVHIVRNRSREEIIVVEPSPSPDRELRSRSKKSSPAPPPSPTKRKPVGGKRRKGKT